MGGKEKSGLASRAGKEPQAATSAMQNMIRAASQWSLHFKRIDIFSLKGSPGFRDRHGRRHIVVPWLGLAQNSVSASLSAQTRPPPKYCHAHAKVTVNLAARPTAVQTRAAGWPAANHKSRRPAPVTRDDPAFPGSFDGPPARSA